MSTLEDRNPARQSISATGRSSIQNALQVAGDLTINMIDADVERFQKKLTSANERRWYEKYETLRSKANTGYSEIVQDPVADIIAEIEQYEFEEAPVNIELEAKTYCLAAVSYLQQVGRIGCHYHLVGHVN